jgi:hypothetical protein
MGAFEVGIRPPRRPQPECRQRFAQQLQRANAFLARERLVGLGHAINEHLQHFLVRRAFADDPAAVLAQKD